MVRCEFFWKHFFFFFLFFIFMLIFPMLSWSSLKAFLLLFYFFNNWIQEDWIGILYRFNFIQNIENIKVFVPVDNRNCCSMKYLQTYYRNLFDSKWLKSFDISFKVVGQMDSTEPTISSISSWKIVLGRPRFGYICCVLLYLINEWFNIPSWYFSPNRLISQCRIFH